MAFLLGHWGPSHAFSALGAQRVISLIHPENERSIRVAERLGERYERRVELSRIPHHLYATERGRWEG